MFSFEKNERIEKSSKIPVRRGKRNKSIFPRPVGNLTETDEQFDEIIKYISSPTETLKVSNDTRWNSTYDMLISYKKSLKALNIIMLHSDDKQQFCFSKEERNLMN